MRSWFHTGSVEFVGLHLQMFFTKLVIQTVSKVIHSRTTYQCPRQSELGVTMTSSWEASQTDLPSEDTIKCITHNKEWPTTSGLCTVLSMCDITKDFSHFVELNT